MTDSNTTRAANQERYMRNKNAFDEVIGDPFAKPEPIQGHYQKLKARSSIVAQQLNNESQSTANSARPTPLDFFCDVEHLVCIGLSPGNKDKNMTADPELVRLFAATYIHEITTKAFTPEERSKMEQRIGQLFRAYKLSPVTRYFTTIRKSTHH